MSAYRDGTSPGEARSLEVRVSPRWLTPLLVLVTLLLLVRPWLARRVTDIVCRSGSEWSCEVTVRRAGLAIERRTVAIGAFDRLGRQVGDDGELVVRGDGGQLARFSLEEAGRATAALERLAQLSASADTIQTSIARPVDPLEPFLALLVLPGFLFLGRRARVTFTDEGLRVDGRFVPFADVDEIAVTDEPHERDAMLPRWSLVVRTRDGERLVVLSGALLRSGLARAAARLEAWRSNAGARTF